MAHKVFITREIPDEGIKMLKDHDEIELEMYEKDKKIPREELLERVEGKDIVLSILTEEMDAEVFDAAGDQLKMVANYAVGYNNIDVEEAKKRDIVATNTPNEEINESVAEHAVGLMLGLAHRIVEGDKFTRAGKYKSWGPTLLLGNDLQNKTVGIIGTGNIGSRVVEILNAAFNMTVLYNDIEKRPELEEKTGAQFREKEDLLKEADIVSLHVPLLDSTRHLISSDELDLMKETAFLINTSRGPVIDEKALLEALRDGKLGGVGLDVYECEPLIDCDPDDDLELREFDNVILTPHTASATLETRQTMSRVAAKNIIAFVEGDTPPNVVTNE
jgi:glyoxylate reductase